MTKLLRELVRAALTTSPLESAYRSIDERAEEGLMASQPSGPMRPGIRPEALVIG